MQAGENKHHCAPNSVLWTHENPEDRNIKELQGNLVPIDHKY